LVTSLTKFIRNNIQPLVSVITLCYNFEHFIADCIQSVLNQKYSNWEMIIVDDCSIDNSTSIIHKYAAYDQRIRPIYHNKRWGLQRLRDSYNQALKTSRGTLIATLEGDDFWPKDKLHKQIADFIDPNIVLSYGNWIITTSKGHNLIIGDYYSFPTDQLINVRPGLIVNLFASLKFYLITSTVMIRKRTLFQIGGFQKNSLYPYIDIPTYLTLSFKGKYYYHNDLLGYYRKHSESLSFNNNFANQELIQEKMMNYYLFFINQYSAKLKFLDREKIINTQRQYLHNKRENRSLILLFHYFAFGDNIKVNLIIKSMLNFKYSYPIKTRLVALGLSIFPCLWIVESILYFYQYLKYYLRRMILNYN